MSLRQAMEKLLATSLEDPKLFGYPLIIERIDTKKRIGDDPLFYGQVGEIGADIDPDTGVLIATEHSHASVRISTLVSRGFVTQQEVEHNSIMNGWVVEFSNISGLVARYMITKTMVDHTLGLITFNLALVKKKS